ncbi:alpha/beta fold hydrolase [Streptomyces sp. WAC07061]|uniref:alpha/beta fold hydrolase n=1 Tax=Streptomyces sp. WAC07061 TaxID=2487410 RepID=UPI000F7ACF1F|nr:alpha/beta fold hydrolase [Streptomyces sp. WAC07061]RSS56316.1 alpha/beta fold hydrolase [Streptomyces sp. WAC07061]
MKIATLLWATRSPGPAPRTSPRAPSAAVVLLHGGRAEDLRPPPLLNLPALRMRLLSAALARALSGRTVLITTVRYRRRGWNGPRADAARDAVAALDRLHERHGDIPVVLIGHSMGGRAALRAAGHPCVRGVIALAPWCPPEDPVGHLAGREVYVLHDEADRVTSARQSWDFVRRARAAGASAVAVRMEAGGHTMLRGSRSWHRHTTEIVKHLLSAR